MNNNAISTAAVIRINMLIISYNMTKQNLFTFLVKHRERIII